MRARRSAATFPLRAVLLVTLLATLVRLLFPADADAVPAPVPAPECPFLHAIEGDTGRLFQVHPAAPPDAARTVTQLARPYLEPGPSQERFAFDGLAFDEVRRRLYFASGIRAEGEGGTLHFYDPRSDTFGTAGDLVASAAGASFFDGGYYYVGQGSNELRRVDLTNDGSVDHDVLVAVLGQDREFQLEGLAILDGIAYGSTSSDDPEVTPHFFAYDLVRGTFTTLSTSSGTYLQLAFGQDGTLYGVSSDDGVFYRVDHGVDPEEGGDERTVATDVASEVSFSDLAAARACSGR